MSGDDDRVMMENPNTGRDDMRIARAIYEPVRQAILEALEDLGEVPFSELHVEVEQRTPPELWEDASLKWYTTTVKLDLEAKGLLVKSGSPQVLSLPA
jgi:DNA-binding transcriptional ArsR family regulator